MLQVVFYMKGCEIRHTQCSELRTCCLFDFPPIQLTDAPPGGVVPRSVETRSYFYIFWFPRGYWFDWLIELIKNCLTQTPFIKVPVPKQRSERSCICVNRGIICTSIYDFTIWLRNCSFSVVFFVLFVIWWFLYCLSFLDLRLLITPLVA